MPNCCKCIQQVTQAINDHIENTALFINVYTEKAHNSCQKYNRWHKKVIRLQCCLEQDSTDSDMFSTVLIHRS